MVLAGVTVFLVVLQESLVDPILDHQPLQWPEQQKNQQGRQGKTQQKRIHQRFLEGRHFRHMVQQNHDHEFQQECPQHQYEDQPNRRKEESQFTLVTLMSAIIGHVFPECPVAYCIFGPDIIKGQRTNCQKPFWGCAMRAVLNDPATGLACLPEKQLLQDTCQETASLPANVIKCGQFSILLANRPVAPLDTGVG